jgi:hypothetical protein
VSTSRSSVRSFVSHRFVFLAPQFNLNTDSGAFLEAGGIRAEFSPFACQLSSATSGLSGSLESVARRFLTEAVLGGVFVWDPRQVAHVRRLQRYISPFAHALSRLRFGSNSHARRRSSKGFTPARRLRSPTADFDCRAQNQRAKILRVTLRKSLSVGCPRLSALTSAWEWRPLAFGRPRQMGTKGERNVPQSR